MWQERQATLLHKEIEKLLAPLTDADCVAAIKRAVTNCISIEPTNGKNGRNQPWSLLPVIVCESISSRGRRALPAAAAIQLFRAAAEVFDDVEDADAPDSIPSKFGAAVATNTATALLLIGEKALTRLTSRGVPYADVVSIIKAVNSYYITSCIGQHSDIVQLNDITVSEAQYLKIIEYKTASQIECACYVGGVLGNGNKGLIRVFSKLGQCLGMAAQIANDIRGVTTGNDVSKGKISLPVIYAFTQAGESARRRLNNAFSKRVRPLAYCQQTIDLLYQTGAIQYAAIKMETYRQKGLERLSEAKRMGASVEKLETFFK